MKKLLEIISVVGGLVAIAAAMFLPLETLLKVIIFFLPPILLIFAIVLVGITVAEKNREGGRFYPSGTKEPRLGSADSSFF